MGNRDLFSRVVRLERTLSAIEGDLSILAQAIATGLAPEGAETDSKEEVAPRSPSDQVWSCEKCGKRLALYDVERDLLRIRWREFIAHVRTGVGGMIRIVCRDCSHINEIHDATDHGEAG